MAKTVVRQIVLDEGEPYFVLRGSSPLAPQLVSIWAACAKLTGRPDALVRTAKETADKMRQYLSAHNRKEFPILAAIEQSIMVQDEDATPTETKETH